MNDKTVSGLANDSLAFYGRKEELQILLDAWHRARKGSPQWVSVNAETGVGKTRLVQEFYRCISTPGYLKGKGLNAGGITEFDPEGYWPDDLPIESENLGLNPRPESFPEARSDTAVSPPWLWWGIRGDPRERRNGAECLCAARGALESLELHTTRLVLKAQAKELAFDVGKKVADVLSGGLLDVAISFSEILGKSVRVLNLLPLDAQAPAAMAERKRADLQDLLTKAIVHFLDREIPVVLVLDDAHWLDDDSIGFIDRLAGKLTSRKTSSKLLIISTCWKQEWNQGAAIRGSYERFCGEKPAAIELGVVDDFSARTYLKSHLPGIEERDVRLILDRAQGNFRYLTELQLLLRSERWHFIDKDLRNPLSELGREMISSEKLGVETCIEARFRKFPDDVQAALQRSSYQGPRFDPSLTMQVTRELEEETLMDGETTIRAIALGENPGAMITRVDENYREFLQGPYWRLIRKLCDKREGEEVKAAYHRLLMKAIDDPELTGNKVLASVALQRLEEEVDEEEAVRLYGWLIKYAWSGREAHSTISHIHGLLRLDRFSIDVVPPDVALIALRCRNQFGYGIKSIDPGWDRDVETAFERVFVLPLQHRVFEFIRQDLPPETVSSAELIDWCDALVEYRSSLGHMNDYLQWLQVKVSLFRKIRHAVLRDRVDLNADCVVDICELVISQTQKADSPKDWDAIFKLLIEADECVERIRNQDRKLADVYFALCQAVILRFTRKGREFLPAILTCSDEYRAYCRVAEVLGNILSEHDWKPDDSTISRMLGNRDFKGLEAAMRASSFIQELAAFSGYALATEFIDWSLKLSERIAELIGQGVYTPPRLAVAMLEIQNAAAAVLRWKARTGRGQREFGNALPDALKGHVTAHMIADRPVGVDEAQYQLHKALESIERYREMAWLPVGLLKMAAISQIELFEVIDLSEKPDRERVGKVFEQMLEDAELAEDVDRLSYGEPVELLQWLIMLYDRWVVGAPGCETMWDKLVKVYPDARLDRMVGQIRRHQASYS